MNFCFDRKKDRFILTFENCEIVIDPEQLNLVLNNI